MNTDNFIVLYNPFIDTYFVDIKVPFEPNKIIQLNVDTDEECDTLLEAFTLLSKVNVKDAKVIEAKAA